MAEIVHGLKKKEIRKIIKESDSITMFIHPLYTDFDGGTDLPRVPVTKSYAMEFMSYIPDDMVPGVERRPENSIRLWPAGISYDGDPEVD